MARRPARSSRATTYTPADQRDFIELARKRFKQAESADTKQRERELDDLQFYAGAQWDPLVIQAREGQPANNSTNAQGLPPVPPRPAYVINKVREPVRQVLNQERQADLGVEIAAADDFGEGSSGVSAQEIELREGLVRRIQRESQAADARSWAFQRAVIAGRGFYRVMTRYVPGKTFDQDIYVDRIYNQASVCLDPSHEQPDGSDAEWGFIGTDLPWDRYKAEYGKVNDEPNPLVQASASEWRQLGDELPGWFTADGETRSVRIVEYWYVERVPRMLAQLEDGTSVYEEDIDEGGAPIGVDENGDPLRRQVIDKQIKWAKIDGVQILDETAWPGTYIPIIKVLGEELQPYDSERRAEGMVRPSRDSQRGFNVMVSKWVEQIGLAPIPPWMGAAGFDEGFEMEYALSNTRTLPALHYNTKDLEGMPIGPPTRTSITMEIQAIAGSVQLFDQAIKSTTAIPDPTLGNIDPSLKSGRAIKQVLEQATRGTSHYLDNLARSIRYEGQIINDLLFPIYQRKGRVVRTMNPRGETQAMMLHVPFIRHPQTQQPMLAPAPMPGMGQPPTGTEPPQQVTLTPDATFNVTVKVTKSFDTRREEQESVLSSLVQAEPQLMSVFGDLLFKYNDGPGHDELEARAKAMLAPPVQAMLSGKQAPDPEKQQLQQQVQQLTQMLQTKTAEIQAKGQIELQKDQADNATKLEIARIAQEGQFAVASLKAQLEAVNTAIAAMQEERTALNEAVKTDRQNQQAQSALVHEAAQNQLQRTHEVVQQAVDHAQALEIGSQQHAQQIEQGAQAHQQSLEQGQQAAALAPPPATQEPA